MLLQCSRYSVQCSKTQQRSAFSLTSCAKMLRSGSRRKNVASNFVKSLKIVLLCLSKTTAIPRMTVGYTIGIITSITEKDSITSARNDGLCERLLCKTLQSLYRICHPKKESFCAILFYTRLESFFAMPNLLMKRLKTSQNKAKEYNIISHNLSETPRHNTAHYCFTFSHYDDGNKNTLRPSPCNIGRIQNTPQICIGARYVHEGIRKRAAIWRRI